MPQVSKAPNPLGTAPVGTLLLQYAVPSIIATLISSYLLHSINTKSCRA